MDASTDNPNAAPAPSTFYAWHPPEKLITVHLNVEVCDALGPRATEALKSLPRRGLEVGGLLLGWVEKSGELVEESGELSVIVQDFEPFEAEHARGPSYSLSETDCGRFEQRLEHWRSDPTGLSVVGYYRSHTRPGLYLDQDDFRIIREYFSDPAQVCLLVRPSLTAAGTAGFFFWEDGDIHRESSYLEFPFESSQLSSEAFPIREIPEEQLVNLPAPAAVPVAATRGQAAGWQTTVEKVSRWWWIPMAAGLLMAWALGGHHPAPKSAVAAPAQRQSELALNVGKSGRSLKLSWNRNAPAVQNATSAVLWINDGGRQTKVNLAAGEVESGSVVYWPTTDDVGFRLEVPSPPGTVSESVRTLGEGIHGPAPAPERGSVASSASKTDGPAASERSPANARSRRRAPRKVYAEDYEEAADKQSEKPSPFPRTGAIAGARNVAKSAPVSITGESQKPAAVTPAAPVVSAPEVSKKPTESAPAMAANLPAVPAPRPVQPAHVIVSWEPAPQSAFRRVFGKIPGLNRLKRGQREGQAFVPAKPLHSVTPAVPPDVGAAFAGEGPVSVKVRVERSGQISRVELLSDENRLANLAVHAAEQWRFAPARVGDEPVSSDMILHFHLRDSR